MTLEAKARRILELDKEATKGWVMRDDGFIRTATKDGRLAGYGFECTPNDAAFVTESRTTAPELARAYLRLKSALEWYADMKHWTRPNENGLGYIDCDGGQRARAALKETECSTSC